MLRIRPNERRSCSSLLSELKTYEESILNLEPFSPNIAGRNQQRPVLYQQIPVVQEIPMIQQVPEGYPYQIQHAQR